MRRKLAALVLAAACLTSVTGTGAAAAEEDGDAPSLYDRGLEVVQTMVEMVRSEGYVDALTLDGEIKVIVQAVGAGDYTTPKAAYALSMADEDLETLAATDSMGISDALKDFLAQRALAALMTRTNSLGGAETMAAASMCVYAKTFADESAEGDVIYLYTYDGAAPAAVTFTLGEDHTVTASGVFVLYDGFTCGSVGEIEDFFDDIPVDVTQLHPGE